MKGTERIMLGHGSGGLLMHELLEDEIVAALGRGSIQPDDAAVLPLDGGEVVFTTDSFVVDPIFFPGGDIGSLSVCGTVNDLAVMGAKPLYLSVALILEEGLPIEDLRRVLRSMRRTADEAGVRIVTGDTKVVPHGSADKLFVTTTGIGLRLKGLAPSSSRIRPGDALIVSGSLGEHGLAVMLRREGVEFGAEIVSDVASVFPLVECLKPFGDAIHAIRDPTRGGIASTLNEFASASGCTIEIDEQAIPLCDDVRGACEIFGFDPLHVASEGKLVLAVAPGNATEVLCTLRSVPLGSNASIIGTVTDRRTPRVILRTAVGGRRILEMLAGEQLPRIC